MTKESLRSPDVGVDELNASDYPLYVVATLLAISLGASFFLVLFLPSPQSEFDSSSWKNNRALTLPDCPEYGCPLRPMELSELRERNRRGMEIPLASASRHHVSITHKSNRKSPPLNQDRVVLISPFGAADRDQGDPIDTSSDFFMGVFDGHGDTGHIVAQFASQEIPSRLSRKLNELMHLGHPMDQAPMDAEIRRLIKETFVEVDRDTPPIEATSGGCTAVVILRLGRKLYMANTGDSTMFIAMYHPPDQSQTQTNQRKGKKQQQQQFKNNINNQKVIDGTVTIHHPNTKHKPHFLTEKVRIHSHNGRIHLPPNNFMGSRVVVHSESKNEDVGLAMSRSIGDWEFGEVGVIPDPDVETIDLIEFFQRENRLRGLDNLLHDKKKTTKTTATNVFVVCGTDGLFDARKLEYVGNHLAQGYFEWDTIQDQNGILGESRARRMVEVGSNLVQLASPMNTENYRDDISFVSMMVNF